MILLTLAACLSDLRPDVIEPGPQPDREVEGRALLAAAVEAHGGLDTWRTKKSTELVLSDQWQGMAKLFNPWPDPDVRLHIVQKPGTFDSRVAFLDGSKEGWTWGIENWKTYTLDPSGAREDAPNKDTAFMLPTTQYFVDLPFRIQEAEIVRSVGRQTVGEEEFDVVFATWGGVEKTKEFDQYLVYLNPDTHRIEKVQYTVREIAGFVTGTCHLDDQRLVDGLWIPHVMTVTDKPSDSVADGGMHVMTVHGLRYDSVPREGWEPDAALGPIAGL